jgi:hypothetical protein
VTFTQATVAHRESGAALVPDTIVPATIPPTSTVAPSLIARPPDVVSGIEVLAPLSTGAVLTFGDSITDGYQAQKDGAPETTEGVDADGRWPDMLGRRRSADSTPMHWVKQASRR